MAISTNHLTNSTWQSVDVEGHPGLGSSLTTLFETLKPLIALRTTYAFLPVSLLQQFTNVFQSLKKNFTHMCYTSSSFIVGSARCTCSLLRLQLNKYCMQWNTGNSSLLSKLADKYPHWSYHAMAIWRHLQSSVIFRNNNFLKFSLFLKTLIYQI